MNKDPIEFQMREKANGWWEIFVLQKRREKPIAAFLYHKDAEEFLRWKEGVERIKKMALKEKP